MAKAAKTDAKPDDNPPAGDAGADLSGAPAEAGEPQSTAPATPVDTAETPSIEPAAGEPSAPASIRYRVVAQVFIHGSLIDPKGRKDVYVFAAPGLEGPALKLAPEAAAEDAGDQHSGAGPSSL